MENFIFVIELIGTVAFAISGVVTGLRKNMDVFGLVFLGATTAVGGGLIRDLIIGVTPPSCFQNPVYLIVACLVSAFLCIGPVTRRLLGTHRRFEMLLFAMDSLGLAAFTVVGIRSAMGVSGDFGVILLCFLGLLTGCGGGIIRDLLAGNTPYIFVKHVYATASLVGALAFCLMHGRMNEYACILIAMALIIAMRCLAAHYKWNLPHPMREKKKV